MVEHREKRRVMGWMVRTKRVRKIKVRDKQVSRVEEMSEQRVTKLL